MRRQLLRRASAVIALTWIVAAAVVAGIRATRPTIPSVSAYCAKHPLEGKPKAAREQIIAGLARRVALLDHAQRRELSRNPPMQRIYTSLTTAEKERFIQLTVYSALKEVFRVASALPSTEREKFLNGAFYEMETSFSSDQSAPVNQRRVQGWLEEAVREALFSTSLGLRAELKPVIDQNFPGAVRGL